MTDKLVTVDSFQFLPEAEAARMQLEAEGIRSFLANAQTVTTDWFLGNAIGYIQLQVAADQAEAAQAILENMHALQKLHETESGEEVEIPACLSCGAEIPVG